MRFALRLNLLLCLLALEGKVRICLVEHVVMRSAETRAA